MKFNSTCKSLASIKFLMVMFLLINISADDIYSATQTLFSTDLPAAKWVEFESAGYAQPVTG